MVRGILIAGNECALFSALCVEAAKRVESYATALIPRSIDSAGRGQSSEQDKSSKRQLVLDWNPGSPISGRTLVLSAINKMEHIDDAILVCVPPAYRKNTEDLSPADIDTLIDYHIKGWFFLVRELAAAFKTRNGGTPVSTKAGTLISGGTPVSAKAGTLALVLPELNAASRDDTPDLLGPAVTAAFRSFAQSVLAASSGAPYNTLGFSSSEPGEENAFAAYVFKTMEEGKRNSGKWHKYGKFGLFGR
ncbi:hypothetical protein AGMMS50230_05460 [Spirochaetia bacterium]|nr:hypothetical protein AGMMS50230_05460 [Spirochaetia bacterium]